MRFVSRHSKLSLYLGVAAASLAVATLAGCGLGDSFTPSTVATSAVLPRIDGVVHGGSAPISGAAITLWQTDPNNSGYPNASSTSANSAVPLATTTTKPTGSFSFSGTIACTNPNTSFLYLTSTGGDTGGGANNNAVLISAIGPCNSYIGSSITPANVHLIVNEATTIAAAYALGSFMYVNTTGTAGAQQVYIGAPANNNAVTGSCSGTGSAMTCTAAGLSHAFANATNLVSTAYISTSQQASGFPNATVPGNANGVVPQALLVTLADVLQACVSSTGGTATPATGGTSDTSLCGTLFSYAPSNASTPVYPTDTLTAAINIAKNPARNVTPLFGLVSSSSAFQAALSTQPNDFSVGIYYNYSDFPRALALDANDNVYFAGANETTAGSSAITSGTLQSLSSNGTFNWATANQPYCNPFAVATDTSGHVWVTNDVASTAAVCNGVSGVYYGVYGYQSGSSGGALTNSFTSATTPTAQTQVGPLAIDKFNGIWYARAGTTCTQCLYSLLLNAGGTAYVTAKYDNGTTNLPGLANIAFIQFDPFQNLWMGSTTLTNGYVSVYANSASASASKPTFATASPFSVYQLNEGTSANNTFGVAFDSSTNVWTGSYNQFYELTPAPTSSVITAAPSQGTKKLTSGGSYPAQSQFDGNGALWYTNFAAPVGISAWSISSNVATFTISGTNPLSVGQQVTLSGFATSTFFNGQTVAITGTTTTSFTAAFTASNGSATESGKAASSVLGGIYYDVAPTTIATPSALFPCFAVGTATTCTNPLVNTRGMQIDSTGSIWVASQGNNAYNYPGYVVQIIGSAAPAWPQLSFAKFGTMPQ